MFNKLTKWAYSDAVNKLGLTASELALLRALCWRAKSDGKCDAIADSALSRLTGYKSRQTLTSARKRLKERALIAYEHENKASDHERKKYGSSLAYVYFVRYRAFWAKTGIEELEGLV